MTLVPGPSNGSKVAVAPARACAYAVLRRVFEQGAFAERALRAEARSLPGRDRRLATRLAYGAVQRRRTLDHFAEVLSERPTARLEAPVLAALRLGLYELVYLAGAPDRAVVADAVELAKASSRAGHGLVNAVLRRAAREGTDSLLRGLADDTPEQAALKHSHPTWVARMWWEQLGADAARALMDYDNEPSELALRANTLVMDANALAERLTGDASGSAGEAPAASGMRGTQRGVKVHLDAKIPEAVIVEGPFDVHGSPLWRTGACIAQSRASMLAARSVAPRPGERVLDLCAAPGGKTTHLSALMDARGEVVAVERDRRRAGELASTLRRMHAGNVRIELADAAAPLAGEAPFDRVLVDPPCSGLGTLQARPDKRWRVTEEDVEEMARAQAAILAAGADVLRPGGVVVYSTCTISAIENERVVAAFLDSHDDFTLDDLAAELPSYAHWPLAREGGSGAPVAARCSSTGSTVLTLPHRDRTAGFFIARLRKA
ncbi:MAG: 16S rRNA (cytosine(967)-C(5))-methyltransferase RsmB [Actinobacteria bacterium]|nr:MAG: 16S rRNA (cytosine(967)-C(5))-methyltransferase RsmB [Actinomycetota bacterium]